MIRQVVLWLLLVGLLPASATPSCVVDPRTTVSLQIVGGIIALPIEINGIAATFKLDTGAQRSVVTEAAIHRLGLARDEWVGTTLSGVGGIVRRANADPRSLSLGGVPLVRRTLNHDTSLTVGILPAARPGNLVIDGLLGRDFLSAFDLDLDMPGHRLALYQVSGCSGHFLPWTDPYTVVPVTLPLGDAVIVPLEVDGKPLRAMLDTGASASLLAAPGIYRLGLNQTTLAQDPTAQVSGLGPRLSTAHQHQFHSLRIGNQTIESPVFWVEPVRLTPFVDMLLGVDWLAGRRVWISFATKQLFTATP